MKASVYSNAVLIGRTDLKPGDISMGHVYGDLTPTKDYFQIVQLIVWEFNSNTQPDYEKWQSLNLRVQLETGEFLSAWAGFTIDDVPQLPDQPKRIDICGLESDLNQLFLTCNGCS